MGLPSSSPSLPVGSKRECLPVIVDTEVSSTDQYNNILKYNASLVQANTSSDFDYDPHTKHYSGAKKIFKGWCSSLRFADKIMNMDFIHTSSGFPVYMFDTDNFHDLRERFEYIDQRWERDDKIRQTIVRAPNPGGRTIEVSILANDLERNAQEIIELMFNRWIQENDFKYLDNHFGIKENIVCCYSIEDLPGWLCFENISSNS